MEPDVQKICDDLKKLTLSEQAHLEKEFENYDNRYPLSEKELKVITTKELLIYEVQTLSESLAEQVLDYLQYLKTKKNKASVLPEGRPADYLLQFAGVISKGDLKIMSEEIEKGCERVDINEW